MTGGSSNYTVWPHCLSNRYSTTSSAPRNGSGPETDPQVPLAETDLESGRHVSFEDEWRLFRTVENQPKAVSVSEERLDKTDSVIYGFMRRRTEVQQRERRHLTVVMATSMWTVRIAVHSVEWTDRGRLAIQTDWWTRRWPKFVHASFQLFGHSPLDIAHSTKQRTHWK